MKIRVKQNKVANFELNENRFLAENLILMQSKVKLRIKKNGLIHVTGYWIYFEVDVV